VTAESLLGDYRIEAFSFPNLETALGGFSTKNFREKNEHEKRELVSRTLYELIESVQVPTLLLPAIVEFIGRVAASRVIDYYTFSSFELWLNQFSGLSEEESYRLRGKIIGRFVPRDEYQVFFPIGMGKRYEGTHFVTGHSSPDLDTTVASFWGWVDAFGACVGKGLHIWNVPGGAPSQVEVKFLFNDLFGDDIFKALSKTRSKLTLCSFDLMTQEGFTRKMPHEKALSLDHERHIDAVVIVDQEGYYLGDWRSFDVESVRQVITAFENCLRWMENHIQSRLISFFSTAEVAQADLPLMIQEILERKISDWDPVRNLTLREQRALQLYLEKVLKVSSGLESSFGDFTLEMERESIAHFTEFKEALEGLNSAQFFKNHRLIEDRAHLLTYLKRLFKSVGTAFKEVHAHVECLEIAMQIKNKVFGHSPHQLSYRADLEEVKTKMGNYTYLTVNYPDTNGKLIPVGVIHAPELQKNSLGTVTLRDFCNREETKIPPFLDVISVIDHHKTALNTFSPPMAFICDAQSSNVLVAQLSFAINDNYSTSGMSLEAIDDQIGRLKGKELSKSEMRLYQRLLQKKMVAQSKGSFAVCPKREYIEYLHFLFAILDDTDLLTKVTLRDVDCVAALLNRLKTLALGRETETIHFDDLVKDELFIKRAAKKLLQNRDLYSLYSKIYLAREHAVDANILSCLKGEESNIFTDTKVQNGCCQVGQTKIFEKNFVFLHKKIDEVRHVWLTHAATVHSQKPEIDFYLHMVSTVASADQLISGDEIVYRHQDELWLFVPQSDLGAEHLRAFLISFQKAPHTAKNALSVQFIGPHATWLARIFEETFLPLPKEIIAKKEGFTYAVIKVNPGSMNSRKAMVSPYLPKLNE
jgi:hypothetical protein